MRSKNDTEERVKWTYRTRVMNPQYLREETKEKKRFRNIGYLEKIIEKNEK